MLPMIDCPWCATSFTRRRHDQCFCTPTCQAAFNRQAKVEGARIVHLAKVWRAGRGSTDVAKRAFQELTSILDLMNAEDREKGRNLAKHVGRILERGRYIDRRR